MEPRERGGRSKQGHWLRPFNAELRSMGFFLYVVGGGGMGGCLTGEGPGQAGAGVEWGSQRQDI